MIKPYKSLLLLLYVGVILGMTEFLPDEVAILKDYQIKFPKITQAFATPKEVEYADISTIRKKFEEPKTSKNPVKKDSIPKEEKKVHKKFIPDSLRLNPELKIQYPEGKENLLFNFFSALSSLARQDTLIRVVHFGDSQLEGDRITAFLREKFQGQFGGCGVGIANIVDKLGSKTSIAQSADAIWKQTLAYGPKYRKNNPNYYGILGDYYKFQMSAEPKWTKASLNYIKSPYATETQSKVENIKILYRNPDAPFELTVNTPQGEEIKTKIETSENVEIFQYKLKEPFERVQIGVASGAKSPEIYGVALDCNKGITFDNVPLRGSSGIHFVRINQNHLKKQFQKLNVKFAILQFGVNVVPNPVQSYGWYENMFYNQLAYLKKIDPELNILVIGVSDMSRNIGGMYESYPNIEKIRNAQRNAAFRAGCAFWDLYEAMGGKNSMPSWVFAKPVALANKDFTHFTSKGASIVAEMLYKALLTEYDRFNELHN